MNQPGVWILGDTEKQIRESRSGRGGGVRRPEQQPQWIDPPKVRWDYTHFGAQGSTQPRAAAEHRNDLRERFPAARASSTLSRSTASPIRTSANSCCKQGTRYRLTMRNRTDDAHPMHLHRHLWEVRSVNGKPTAGLMKDVVVAAISAAPWSTSPPISPG